MFSLNITLSVILTILLFHRVLEDARKPPTYDDWKSLGLSQKNVFRASLGLRLESLIDSLARTTQESNANPTHRTSRQKLVLLYLVSILLSNSYAPEPNPGPVHNPEHLTTGNRPNGNLTSPSDSDSSIRPTNNSNGQGSSLPHSSWMCGTCDATVSWNDRGLACEKCGQWYHGHCQSVNTTLYEKLGENFDTPWYCAICKTPNSTTMFDLHGVTLSDVDLGLQNSNEHHSASVCNMDLSGVEPNKPLKPIHASTPTRSSQQNKWKERPLRIIGINFQSAPSKKAELPNLIDSIKPDVIIGSETWLDGSIENAEFMPSTYKVYRKDRNRDGGGVFVAVHTNLVNQQEVKELEVEGCEIKWVKIKIRGQRTLYIAAFYRPKETDEPSLIKLDISIQRALQTKKAYLIVGGDFNCPDWDWSNPTKPTLKPDCSSTHLHHYFLDVMNDNGLEQIVRDKTRGKNTLDLFFTNVPQLIPRVEVLPGLSDHDIPFCELTVNTKRKRQTPRTISLYGKADWINLKSEATKLSNKMLEIQRSGQASSENLWKLFKDTITEGVSKFVPQKQTKTKVNLPWITEEIRRLIRKRDRLYKRMKKSGSDELREQMKQLRSLVQKKIRKSYWKHLNDIFTEDELTPDSKNKRFWTFIKHQRSCKVGISPLKQDGQMISNPREQAELLNRQFQSVFGDGKTYTDDEFIMKTGMATDDDIPLIDNVIITRKGVKALLEKLNPHKACGPDGIRPILLRNLANELTPGLTALFNVSLSTGIVPNDWKLAHVTPIFKKGEQYDPANYRPVSLTSIVCKAMEHIIVSAMMNHLESHQLLNDCQHGFRKMRSCETQLLEFSEDLVSGMERGIQNDVLVMDFSKAFDKVNHSLLLHKLQRYGIRGKLNAWIGDFLKDRKQAVMVEGTTSSAVDVKSGVPQGSVLGPSLFLVYIDDLPDQVSSTTRMFADDTAVSHKIAGKQDCQTLQNDLNQLAVWENRWDMEFHPAKCLTLHVTRSRSPTLENYVLHEHQLKSVPSTKYLGVTVTNQCKWDEHINNICGKANKMLGFLKRNLKINSRNIKEKAYKAMVRPHLEYACSVWDPHTANNIDKIEAIQRRAARYVTNRYRNTSSVSNMLGDLGWSTLQERRKNARLFNLYKIRNGLIHCPTIKRKLILPPHDRPRRTHDKQYCQISTRTDYRAASFLPRTIKDWNDLHQEAVDAETLDTFVSRVSKN